MNQGLGRLICKSRPQALCLFRRLRRGAPNPRKAPFKPDLSLNPAGSPVGFPKCRSPTSGGAVHRKAIGAPTFRDQLPVQEPLKEPLKEPFFRASGFGLPSQPCWLRKAPQKTRRRESSEGALREEEPTHRLRFLLQLSHGL